MTIEYRQALKELNTILNTVNKAYIRRLPSSLIAFIKENMDNSYVCNINVNTPVNEQELKDETKILLSIIYRNYWCDEEKKQELIRKEKYNTEQNKEIIEEYDSSLLSNNSESVEQSEDKKEYISSVVLVEHKESIFSKIISWFKNLFKKK